MTGSVKQVYKVSLDQASASCPSRPPVLPASCRSLKPIFQKVVNEFPGKVHYVMIDIEKDAEVAEAAGVTGTPTIQFFKNKVWRGPDEAVSRREGEGYFPFSFCTIADGIVGTVCMLSPAATIQWGKNTSELPPYTTAACAGLQHRQWHKKKVALPLGQLRVLCVDVCWGGGGKRFVVGGNCHLIGKFRPSVWDEPQLRPLWQDICCGEVWWLGC